jgi:hypothetical protein
MMSLDIDLKSEVPVSLPSLNSALSQENHSTLSVGLPTTPQTPQPKPSIDDVFSIERRMLEMPQVALPVRHIFSPGVYARELTIPAGVCLTGAVHKYEQLNILSAGTMHVLTDDGIQLVSAPFTIVSPAGTKRIAYAETDCVWTTILGTDETDPELIEKHFVLTTEQDYLTWLSQSQVLSQQSEPLLP